VFSFTVPLVLAKPDPEDPPPPPSPPPQITKPFLLIASASALVAESLGEAAVRSGAARGFTAISLPTDRNTVATALAAAPPPPGDAMVMCNVAIVDLAGPPTIHGGSLELDAQLSPDWWMYGKPYSEMFQSLHVPVVAIVPLCMPHDLHYAVFPLAPRDTSHPPQHNRQQSPQESARASRFQFHTSNCGTL